MDESYDVFISYSRKDTETADRILAALEKAGFRCFIDRVGISGGADFPAVLSRAILSSRLILMLASEHSYKSEYTQKELVFAVNNKGSQFIFPLIIDGSTLPKNFEFLLSNINYRMLSDDYRIEEELIDDIRHRLENPDSFTAAILDGVDRMKSRKKPLLIAAACVLALLLASAGGYALYRNNMEKALQREARQGEDRFKALLDSSQTFFAKADSLRDLGRPEELFSQELQALDQGEALLRKAKSVRQSLEGNPYASFPDRRFDQLSTVPQTKRDSIFAIWKPYAMDNWNTWQHSRLPFDREIARQSVNNALTLHPNDLELKAAYQDLSL